MVSTDQILNLLGSYFLNPIGLLALATVVPLVIFYLVKRKPEKEIMPSMMFFMKDKKSGKARKAFRKIQRNNLFLLHLLILFLISAAVAQPFLQSEGSSEEAVIVLDNSASMANQIDSAVEFAGDNVGDSNTLIISGSDTEVVLEDSSASQLRSYLSNVEETHLPGDPARGLELASRYDGDIVLASDLQQAEDQRAPEEVVDDLRNDGRSVTIFEPEQDNSWGIVDVDYGEDESSIDVKNMRDTITSVTVRKDNEETSETIEPGAVETVTFSTSPGENVIELEQDGFEPDNTAYISVPEERSYRALMISEEENPYLEKAFELIEFIELDTDSPPIENSLDYDLYIMGETGNILSDTVNEVESQVEEGSSLIIFGHETVFDTGFDSLPVERSYELRETEVSIHEPQNTGFETSILDTNKTDGYSYTEPEEAMVRSSYGEGKVFFYNIDDVDFRNRLTYPLLWQNVLIDLLDQPSIEELNLETGEEINHSSIETPSGETEEGVNRLEKTGFYDTGDRVYAANLVDIGESVYEEPDIEIDVDDGEMIENEIQNLVIMLAGLLLLGELIYLRRIGEL